MSIIGRDTQVDVGLPPGVPIAALLPDLVALIDGRRRGSRTQRPDSGAITEHWTLSRIGQPALSSAHTLDDAHVEDGELLMLRSVASRETPALFDDVIDAVARLNDSAFRHWTANSARVMGWIVAVGATLLAAGVLATLRSSTGSWIPGVVALVLAIGFGAAAIVVARQYREFGTSTVLTCCALALAFVGALLITPHGFGAPHLMFGFAAVAATSVVVYRVTSAGPMVNAAAFTGAIIGLITTAVALIWDVDSIDLGAGLCAGAVIMAAIAVRFTILLARLPLPPVPTAGAAIDPIDSEVAPTIEGIGAIGAMALPSAVELERRAHTANHYLTGILAAVVAAGITGVLLVLTPFGGYPGWKAVTLACCVALIFALRGRAHSDIVQAATLIGGGALTFAAGAAAMATHGTLWVWVSFGALLALAVIGLLCGVVAPHQEFSPVMKRTGELIEYTLVIVVVPLACWVIGVYGYIRNLP